MDALPLWLFATTAVIVLAAIGALATLSGAIVVARALRSGRRAGYPWPVLLSVAWDAGPDTAALLNGQGPYVLLGDTERDDLVHRRHLAQRWLVGGAALTALMPLLWWLGAAVVGDAGARWLTVGELLLAVCPLVIGLVWRAVVLGPERHLRRHARRTTRRSGDVVSVAPALVEGWLSSGGGIATARSPRHPIAAHGVPVIVAVVAALGVLPILLGVHGFALWYGPSLRGEVESWLRYQLDVGVGDSWSALDERLAREISRIPIPRREVGRVVRAHVAADTGRMGRAVEDITRFVGPLSIAELRRDTVWAWMPGWRSTVAQIAAFKGEGAVKSPRVGWWGGVGRALAAAALALEAGDTIAARERVREALVASRYLLRQGSPQEGLSQALVAYQRVSQAMGDTVAAQSATELIGRAVRYGRSELAFFALTPYTLMSDPDSPPGERFISAVTEAPGIRRRLALGAVGGLCLNGREWLFGMSARRRALIERVASAALDLPSIGRDVRALAAAYDTQVGSRRWVFQLPARMRWCGEAQIFNYGTTL